MIKSQKVITSPINKVQILTTSLDQPPTEIRTTGISQQALENFLVWDNPTRM
jgi:hypothetical protein